MSRPKSRNVMTCTPATSRTGALPPLPCLLGSPPVQFDCLWIGRNHRAATGTGLVDRVLAGGSVTLIDTSRGGRTSGHASPRWRAGSTPCSSSATTWVRDAVARACESLGGPWYGPTFDS
jgi:hypothetical protein